MALDTWRGEAGGQKKPGIGSYLDQLMAAGVISPDRIYNQQDGNTLYMGNDGNIYMPTYRQTSSGTGQNMALDPIDYSNPASVWRIPLSNIDPKTGKDKLNSVTDFLDPTTGQMYDQGKAGFNQMRWDEKLTLAIIAAMTGGAAATGMGLIGGAAGGASGTVGSGAGFIGEGAMSGVGAWDAALTSAPSWSSAAAGAGSAGLSEGIGNGAFLGENMASGVPMWDAAATNAGLELSYPAAGLGGSGSGIPAEGTPKVPDSVRFDTTNVSGTPPSSGGNSLFPEGWSKYLGHAATIAGGLLGGKPQEKSQTETRSLPDYLQGPVNGLLGATQTMTGAMMPAAQAAGSQMVSTGQGLLANPIAKNGYGTVQMERPNVAQDPYLTGVADDVTRRTRELIDSSLLGIQGQSVGNNTLGGSRQGVAQGTAISKGADYLSGQLAGLYSGAWNADMNRALSKYNTDVGFYGQQRNADLAQAGLGAGLIGQGFQTQLAPLGFANDVYKSYAGNGSTTTTSQQGGGGMGMLGGALGAAQWAQNMGLFGNTNQQQQQPKTPGWW